MLTPRRLRLPTLPPRDHPRGQPHLSSASGLVGVAPAGGDQLWLVTDAGDPARPSELLELRWGG